MNHPRLLLPRLALLLLGTLLAGPAAEPGPADGYAIQFSRKYTVGDHYRATSHGSSERSMTTAVDGQTAPPNQQAYTVDLTAECEVLAVTPAGREQKTRLTMEKCTRTVAGQTSDLVPAGTEVVAERVDKQTVYTVGGNPADPGLSAALNTAGVTMSNDEGENDDTIFGTKERKRVGDTWSINATAALASLTDMGLTAPADSLTGSITVVEATESRGEPVIRLNASMTLQGLTPPLPPGATLKSSSFSATMSGLFPVDIAKRTHEESTRVSMEIVLEGMNGDQLVTMTVIQKDERESQFIAH